MTARRTSSSWRKKGLCSQNTDTWMPCPGSYGFVSDLPERTATAGRCALQDCWCWTDSQESAPISPAMFEEFFLPYIAEVTRPFGLTYYGCCEAVHDRFERIAKGHPEPSRRLRLRMEQSCPDGRAAGKEVRVLPQAHPRLHQRRESRLGSAEEGRARHAGRGAGTATWSSASGTSTRSTATGPGWPGGCA